MKVFESIIRDTMSKYPYDINLLHQTNKNLFLESHVVHSYYMFSMIELYHLTNIFLLMQFILSFQKPLTVFPIPDFV